MAKKGLKKGKKLSAAKTLYKEQMLRGAHK